MRALIQRMRVVLVHTRYADSIEAMVAEHGALSCLWWSRDAVQANFEACLANAGESVVVTLLRAKRAFIMYFI